MSKPNLQFNEVMLTERLGENHAHIMVGEEETDESKRICDAVLEEIYGSAKPPGSDGVYGHDAESTEYIRALMELPDEWSLVEKANYLCLSPEFEKGAGLLNASDLIVSRCREVVVDPETGEPKKETRGFIVNISASATLINQHHIHPEELGSVGGEGNTGDYPPDDY